jgi:SEC-C motif-containing protein
VFDACCGPLLAGQRQAATAEALMRSRYTAFARQNVDYLTTSHEHPEPQRLRRELALRIDGQQWLKLEIVEAQQGGAGDKIGFVTFVATYLEDGQIGELRERSRFRRKNGRWYYVSAVE